MEIVSSSTRKYELRSTAWLESYPVYTNSCLPIGAQDIENKKKNSKIARLLMETSTALIAVAESIGYQSEAAFSQAFKKQYGMRPGEFRRAHSQVAA